MVIRYITWLVAMLIAMWQYDTNINGNNVYKIWYHDIVYIRLYNGNSI